MLFAVWRFLSGLILTSSMHAATSSHVARRASYAGRSASGRNAVRTQLDMGTAGMSPPLHQQVLYLAPLLGAMLMMANSGSICESPDRTCPSLEQTATRVLNRTGWTRSAMTTTGRCDETTTTGCGASVDAAERSPTPPTARSPLPPFLPPPLSRAPLSPVRSAPTPSSAFFGETCSPCSRRSSARGSASPRRSSRASRRL